MEMRFWSRHFAALMCSTFVVVGWLGVSTAEARIVGKDVEYEHDGQVLQGYLVFDDEVLERRPGVLVVHEWKGLGAYAKSRAHGLAKLGYIAFAADMYGKGVYAKNHEEAAKLSGLYRTDRSLMRERVLAGLDVLKQYPGVDQKRLGAIGYCFGGTTVLELARADEEIKGVVSFHGGLSNPNPEDSKDIQAKVLVLHGAKDPHIKQEEVSSFVQEMRAAGVDWQLIQYGNAVHSFTVPEAGDDPTTGVAYSALADQRSWEAMKDFLREAFYGTSSG